MTKYLTAYALAISETNACGGVVVTAATLGSAGILPAVLLMCKKLLKTSNEEIINALAVAALIADIARTNGSIAGAEVGCQGECGVACSMAAAAYGYLIGLNNEEIFEAAAIGLKHHLGLTCDPVLGEIYSPCIERNVMGAIRGVDAANNVYMTRNKHN
jgi:L-serine dehydratase